MKKPSGRSDQYNSMTAGVGAGKAKGDGLICRLVQLKHKQWYRGPALGALDDAGRRLYFRSGDLAARLCLNGEAEELINEGGRQAACTLTHAERYLSDRLAYQLAPWPKGLMKIELDDARDLPVVSK